MSWFFVADTHFGHGNIIKFCKRPFLSFEDSGLCDLIERGTIPHSDLAVTPESIREMDECILNSINNVVGADDNLVIVGDFCLCKNGKTNGKKSRAEEYREKINCKNVYLILGNHDDRNLLKPLFTAIYENYLFKIDGQMIFASHYPARSWDRAAYGSWMIYGHVHNAYFAQDSGGLSKYHRHVFEKGFRQVLGESLAKDSLIEELLSVVSSVNGIDLTVDVGVDHVRQGVPFGTPWSMDDLRKHMEKKKNAWELRNNIFQQLKKG